MNPDDVEQSLDTSNAVDKYVIPGYKNGIGKRIVAGCATDLRAVA